MGKCRCAPLLSPANILFNFDRCLVREGKQQGLAPSMQKLQGLP
ncbi:hypothetical protein CsSME_00009017 [Camellia sinensis var. sinensis]